jgi:hypothetical protein
VAGYSCVKGGDGASVTEHREAVHPLALSGNDRFHRLRRDQQCPLNVGFATFIGS